MEATTEMPSFNEDRDPNEDEEDVELVNVGTKVRRPLKEDFQEGVRNAHGGRIRGVFRFEVENALMLRNYLFEQNIQPSQAIERLAMYENLMPIEGELRRLSDNLEQSDAGGEDGPTDLAAAQAELEELNENIRTMLQEFERQKSRLDRIEHDLNTVLYQSGDDE